MKKTIFILVLLMSVYSIMLVESCSGKDDLNQTKGDSNKSENTLAKASDYEKTGISYYKKGKYDKALEYYYKALKIDEKVLGKEHPNTAGSYNNIGNVYDKQGKYNKALEYLF